MQVYFGRWELLQRDDLLDIIPIEALTHDQTEDFLENVMIAHAVPLGAFPYTAYVGCCASGDNCQNSVCSAQRLSRRLTVGQYQGSSALALAAARMLMTVGRESSNGPADVWRRERVKGNNASYKIPSEQ